MPSLATLKKDMEFMRDMEEIVDIFKMTAMFQFRVLQKKGKKNDDFRDELADVWSLLLVGREDVEGISLSFDKKIKEQEGVDGALARTQEKRDQKNLPRAIVLVATDYGFLGGLNARVVDAVLKLHPSERDEVIVLGERGAHYLEEKRMPYTLFPGVDDDISADRVKKLSDYLLTGYKKKFKKIVLIYPKFMSLGSQKIENFGLLPYVPPAATKNPKRKTNILIECGKEPIEDAFIELWLGYKLLEIFLSSKLSEYAARIMHLEGSWQEIFHLKEGIMFDYFCERHAMQDQTIREISASKVLLKK